MYRRAAAAAQPLNTAPPTYRPVAGPLAGVESKPACRGELGCLYQGAAQLPVRKAGERGGGLFGIAFCAAQRLRHGAAPYDEPHCAFQITRMLVAIFKRAAPEIPLLRIAAGKRNEDWQ